MNIKLIGNGEMTNLIRTTIENKPKQEMAKSTLSEIQYAELL